jgi:hypothetical protein
MRAMLSLHLQVRASEVARAALLRSAGYCASLCASAAGMNPQKACMQDIRQQPPHSLALTAAAVCNARPPKANAHVGAHSHMRAIPCCSTPGTANQTSGTHA